MNRPTVPLIPRKVLFGNPDRAMPEISPDGSQLAFLAPVDGVLNVWVGPAGDPAAARPVTHDAGRGIRAYLWAYTNTHILYIQDEGGDENWRIYAVDLGSGDVRNLTPAERVQARFQQISYKFPDEILVGLNNRVPQLHDVWRLNIRTGEMALVIENPGFAGFLTDDDYVVRLGLRLTPDGGMELLMPVDGGWEVFLAAPMEDLLATTPVDFDRSGRRLYLIDSRGRDTAALTEIDMETGEQTVLAVDPRADISRIIIHPTEKNVQAAAFNYLRQEWQLLDPAVEADWMYLRTVVDGELEVTGRSLDDKTWIVSYLVDDGPVRYYRYDRPSRQAHFLFTNRAVLEQYTLAKMHPVLIEARDGLDMVCYYSLPPEAGEGQRPSNPLPMVLYVHGGPWARDAWGLHPVHQLLANRGYAVLSVNYRSSTGLGKAYGNAGNREWGGAMHDDLIDAVAWAAREGIADRDRVAIAGGSYGGYAALAGLTFTPEAFTCAVDIVGPSSLVTLLETVPPYWEPQIQLFTTRVGDHRTEEGRQFLLSRSPLTYVDRIKRPLLIGQGANDPRVKQAESDQIVAAMREKGIPVTYVLYPDEGHGFARPENNLSFWAVAEAFLARCLGGRYEPIGDAFQGSSVEVLQGVEEVPGLREAVGADGRGSGSVS
jgi:dipeptidyl aminopeptidase/acylaminoacyl peptidase